MKKVVTIAMAVSILLVQGLLYYHYVKPILLSTQSLIDQIDWTRYHNYNEAVTILLTLNETYSNVVDVFSIGESVRGRDIYCVRLTNESDQSQKPEVFFVGYHHGTEWVSFELPLYFVVHAAANFNSDKEVTDLLNNSEIYVVVALNVDRLESIASERERNKIKYRYNARGVDLNRNYDFEWSTEARKSGSKPFSEPETQALRDFVLGHNFTYALSFHSGIELILYPWAHTFDSPSNEDKFVEISQGLSNATDGTPYSQSSDLYIAYGVWTGWMYGVADVFALTCEVYGNFQFSYYDLPLGRNPRISMTNDVRAHELLWMELNPVVPAAWGNLEYNPYPEGIERALLRWLPVFFYITNIAIAEASSAGN